MNVSIDIDAVVAKVEAFIASDAGQAKMQNTLRAYKKNNVKNTVGGSKVITAATVTDLANKLATSIKNSSGELPPSVKAAVESITPGAPVLLPDGSYEVTLSFDADLSRPSLEPEKYEGIENIIALFNNGYDAPNAKYVKGVWHGMYVCGKTSREGTAFINRAVDDFNKNYGAEYGAIAVASGEYSG